MPKKVFACSECSFIFATYALIALRPKFITKVRLMYPSVAAKTLIKGFKLEVWEARQQQAGFVCNLPFTACHHNLQRDKKSTPSTIPSLEVRNLEYWVTYIYISDRAV